MMMIYFWKMMEASVFYVQTFTIFHLWIGNMIFFAVTPHGPINNLFYTSNTCISTNITVFYTFATDI